MTKHDPHFPRLYRNYIMSAHRIFWLCCLKTGAKPFAELPNFHTVDYLNCICKSCHVEFLFCVSVSVLSLCLMHTCYSWTRFPFEKDLNLECESLCQPEYLWIFVNSNCKTAAAWKKRKKKSVFIAFAHPLHSDLGASMEVSLCSHNVYLSELCDSDVLQMLGTSQTCF